MNRNILSAHSQSCLIRNTVRLGMDDIIQTYYFLIKNIFHAWHVHFFLFLLLIVIFMHLHISAYQEKRPELENNRYCFVLLLFIVSCLLRTKMINVKQ